MSNSAWGEPNRLEGGGGAHHHVAQAELDGGGGPPHHAHRRGPAEVDVLGEVDPPAQVLGHRRRHEHLGLAQAAADQAVHLAAVEAGVGEGHGGQVGPLLERGATLAPVVALRRVLGDADHGGVSLQAHGGRP
jgi:hypothetical protein